jgi:hypothetical protein
MEVRDTSRRVYPVKRVLGFLYRNQLDRMYFRTEWDNRLPSGAKDITAIPLENFLDCSEALYRFSLRLRDADGKRAGKIPRDKLKRVTKKEYVPTRLDRVRKIHFSYSEMTKRGPDEFYRVKMCGVSGIHTIRLVFMEYFFPFELLCFWKSTGRTGPIFEE